MTNRPIVDVALIVDQKWRDLPGLAAVAACLEAGHGLTVDLLPYLRWREELVLRRPRAIALTHMNGSRSRAIADAAVSLGVKVIVIQTEGRPNNSDTMEYAVGRGADPRGVDLWFTWSDTVRNFMLDRRLLPPERIVTAGVPRFDFYRLPFRSLNETRESMARRYDLDPTRPIVTLATNFTTTKYYRRNADFLARDWRDLGLSTFQAYSDPGDWARRDWEARERTLEVMRQLLRARPDVQLVIKPHPTEEHDRFLEFAAELNGRAGQPRRVAFVGLDYIWNVLAMSDVHVHRLCTTGVEAWLGGLPSIDLHVADYHGWSVKLGGSAAEAVAGHDLVSEAAALIDLVNHYLTGGSVRPEQQAAREAYVRKWLHVVDGCRSQAHAAAIADLLARAGPLRAPSISTIVRARASQWRRRVGANPWHARTRRPSLAARRTLDPAVDQLGQVDPRISDDDVAQWMARVRPIVTATRVRDSAAVREYDRG